MELLTILIATLLVSAISLIGAVTLFLGKKKVQKVMIYLVAFAAGVLLATSVMHLIPESLGVHSHLEHHYDDHAYQIYSHTDHQHTQHNDSDHAHDEKDHDDHDKEHHKEHHEHHHEAWFMNPALFILVGVLLFFGIERYVHWHHHHDVLCEHHHLTPMVIIGDGLHNFLDGLLIAAAFLMDTSLGWIVTFGVILHEIPQELGDFALLVHSGLSYAKALLWNFVSGLTAVVGAVVGYVAFGQFEHSIPLFVAVTAGGFLYIALADIVPQLHAHHKKNTWVVVTFIIGIALIVFIESMHLFH